MRGPFSLNRPKREEPPGPPCNHTITGADAGAFWEQEIVKYSFITSSIVVGNNNNKRGMLN